jgi:hypothetical protein
MKTAYAATPEPISIPQGNCHAFKACPGTTLICHAGVVELTGPALYIYENMHHLQLSLHTGEAYLVEQPGWLHCVAVKDAQLMCLGPPPSRLSGLLEDAAAAWEMQWQRWKPALRQPPTQPGR